MEQTPAHIKRGMKILSGILIGLALFLMGVHVGYENRPAMAKIVGLVNAAAPESSISNADFAPFWKAWALVDEKFPGAEKVDATERMYGAIKGLLASFGDPYTTFFSPEENEAFEDQISGEFSGIGVEIDQKDGVLKVIAPLKGTPAEAAGIKAGDIIIKIGDTLTADLTLDASIDLIRGETGTTVVLTIIREGESTPLALTVTRAKIALPTVDTAVRAKEGVYIISLYSFSAHSYELFREALQQYLDSGYHNLVLDLRGNPGGYLDAAVDIASLFLPEGEVVVKEIGKTPEDVTIHTSHGRQLFREGDKLVILVDKGSASASEILAGALSEHGVGVLAGTQTYGKGSVQELLRLTDDTSVKITVAKWYTPHDVSISDSGLTPKVVIEQGEKADEDRQLDEAVRLLKTL